MSALCDPFAPLWAALEARLAEGRPFEWQPAPLTLHEHAAAGRVLHVEAPFPSPGGAPLIGPCDPAWKDADADDTSMLDVWPELAPHLPRDGQLCAVATVGGNGKDDRHQVRVVDLDTLALGPPITVAAFGAREVN